MTVKLIILDLDGTLLNDQKIITERNKKALEKLHENNVKIAFASGRTNFMMKFYQAPYVKCDYHLAFNGAMIQNLKTGEMLEQITVSDQSARKVWQYLADNADTYTCYSKDCMYFYDMTKNTVKNKYKKYTDIAKAENIILKQKVIKLDKYEIPQKIDPIFKFVTYEKNEKWLSNFRQYIETIPDLTMEATGYDVTGVFDQKVSKENAVLKIAKQLNINKSEICAFGDYDNDLSMFNAAGIKVAMQNATEALKAQADYICPNNNQDGVARFIEENLL